MVNVTSPSTSDGRSPASASAAEAASAASRSSLRPESLENSVAPMPAIAAGRCRSRPLAPLAIGRATRTVPVTWSPRRHRPVTSTTTSPPSALGTWPR